MSRALIKTAIIGAISLGLISSVGHAGGYGGSSKACSPIAPQEAQAFLAYTSNYRDGSFRVRHTESAGAQVKIGTHGETAFGYGASDTDITAGAGTRVWKRTIQRSNGKARNGSGAAGGFSATFLKVRTADGKFFMFKGLASAKASAGPGGTSASRYGFAKSVGGRISR